MVKPFEDPFMNMLEILNEIFIITICYHMFMYTMFVSDSVTQYNGGWSVIAFTILNIIINMSVVVVIGVRGAWLQIKRLWYKY
jgi:hypothetical protein